MKTIAKILLIITVVWAVAFSTLAVGAWYVVHRTGLITVHVTEREWDGDRHSFRFFFPAVFANLAIRMAPIVQRVAEHEHHHYLISDDDGDHHWRGRGWHDGWHRGHAEVWFDDEDLREWMPAIRAAAEEMERYPDATFVDVVDGDEHVKVMARDGAMVVEAHSDDADVEVHIPARTVTLALRTLQDL